jgi:hypothetical protein
MELKLIKIKEDEKNGAFKLTFKNNNDIKMIVEIMSHEEIKNYNIGNLYEIEIKKKDSIYD